jgi:hypothetical protein
MDSALTVGAAPFAAAFQYTMKAIHRIPGIHIGNRD